MHFKSGRWYDAKKKKKHPNYMELTYLMWV